MVIRARPNELDCWCGHTRSLHHWSGVCIPCHRDAADSGEKSDLVKHPFEPPVERPIERPRASFDTTKRALARFEGCIP